MRILFLRPEGSQVPQVPNNEVINIPIFKPQCIKYDSKIIDEYEGIVFTSVNAVKCFKDFDKINDKKIFSIGEVTYKALESIGVKSEFPEEYDSISLANLILKKNLTSVLSIRSKKANKYMKDILTKHKIKYEEIYDYDLILDEQNLRKAIDLLNCKVDIVVLTSSEIAKSVANYLRDECYKIVTIGPITTSSLLEIRKGIKFYQSKQHDIRGIVNLILEIARE